MLSSKSETRCSARILRDALSPDFRQAAALSVHKIILETCHWRCGQVVAGYWPIGSELDLRPLLRVLKDRGCRVVLPVTGAPSAPLLFRIWDGQEPTDTDRVGLPAPPVSSPAMIPDLVLAPLLAFDLEGCRMGYGGGFYDRTLSVLSRSRRIPVIGCAFSAQELPHVPRDETDFHLDMLVSERGLMRFGSMAV